MPTVTIEIAPDVERAVREKARLGGQSLEAFTAGLVQQAATPAPVRERKSFAEVAAPIAQAVQATGMTDEEVGEFFDQVVREVRAGRREPRPE